VLDDPLHPVGEIEMAILKGYIREKIPMDFYFIDAGWYPSKRDCGRTPGRGSRQGAVF